MGVVRRIGDAQTILGRPFAPGLGPDDFEGSFGQVAYTSMGGGMFGILPAQDNYTHHIPLTEYFSNPDNPKITVSSGGSYANGNLLLTTGTGNTDVEDVYYTFPTGDFSSLGYMFAQFDLSQAGLATGSGAFAIGMNESDSIPDITDTSGKEGAWFYVDIADGVAKLYACTSDGQNVTAEDVTDKLIDSNPMNFRQFFIKQSNDGGDVESVSFYNGDPDIESSLMITIQTTLPQDASGESNKVWKAWVQNKDENSREVTLRMVNLLIQA